MKSQILLCGFLVSALAVGTPVPKAFAGENSRKSEQAALKAQATVSKKAAKKLALDEVKKRGLPHPKIKEAELEREKGVLVWSFDVEARGTKDITEVQVDAKTGAIVSVSTESAADEATEKGAKKEAAEEEHTK